MALGLTQPLAEMSTRNLKKKSGGKGQPARRAVNLAAVCLSNVRASTSRNPMGLRGLLTGISLLTVCIKISSIKAIKTSTSFGCSFTFTYDCGVSCQSEMYKR
jgi:hypothetical protein